MRHNLLDRSGQSYFIIFSDANPLFGHLASFFTSSVFRQHTTEWKATLYCLLFTPSWWNMKGCEINRFKKLKKGHCSLMNTLHFNPDKWITGLASKKAWFYAIFSWGDIMWNWTYERNMYFHKVKSTLQYPPIIPAQGLQLLKRAKTGVLHGTPKHFPRSSKGVSAINKSQSAKINWKIKSILSGLATRALFFKKKRMLNRHFSVLQKLTHMNTRRSWTRPPDALRTCLFHFWFLWKVNRTYRNRVHKFGRKQIWANMPCVKFHETRHKSKVAAVQLHCLDWFLFWLSD